MSSWSGRVFTLFSIAWGAFLLATLALLSLSDGYMMSPDHGGLEQAPPYVVIIGVGIAVWYGTCRLLSWFGKRS